MEVKVNDTLKIIPSNRLKEMSDVCGPYLTRIWNNGIIGKYKFPDNLKLTNTAIYEKGDRNLVINYRTVSVLLVISKIFERKLPKQIVSIIDKYPSRHLFRCRKGY